VKLGLERDDIVVKRRVRQKIEMIAEEDASTRAPTDADLSAYLTANQARFVQPAILTFEQVSRRMRLAASQASGSSNESPRSDHSVRPSSVLFTVYGRHAR
jgi:hypothetical protein